MKLIAFALALFLVASPATAGESWWYRASQIAAGAGHGADLATTEYCLGAKKCVETNKALGHFTANPLKFGLVKAGVGTLGIIAVDKIPNRKVGAVVNFVVAGFFTAVAMHNHKVTNGSR